MKHIKAKQENIIKDSLHNLDKHEKLSSNDYGQGLFVGVVSMVMGVYGVSFLEALHMLKPFMPALENISLDRVPSAWTTDLVTIMEEN